MCFQCNNFPLCKSIQAVLGRQFRQSLSELSSQYSLNKILPTLPLFSDPGFDSSDTRWRGAWWLGYIVIPITIAVSSVFLVPFPKHPQPEDPQQHSITHHHSKSKQSPETVFKGNGLDKCAHRARYY